MGAIEGLISRRLALSVGAVTLIAANAAAVDDAVLRFVDRAAISGIDFRHDDGRTGTYRLPETMGSGVAWLDYDVDGAWDVYYVDGGPLPDRPRPDATSEPRAAGVNALYRGRGDGSFTRARRVASDTGYGKGVSVADYDNDGFPDLLVTNWGLDALLRSNGDGTFTDVTAAAGLGVDTLTTSSSWGDLDGDGFLDLFVTTYVEYDLATAVRCVYPNRTLEDYCDPALFPGQGDLLYRNLGDATFVQASSVLHGATADGKGLASTIAYLDDDWLPDIYVANDATPNFAYFNLGEFQFEERGIVSGLGVDSAGKAQAGMGIDVGDLDGDRLQDIVVTNFEFESYNLYRQLVPAVYLDDTRALGFGETTLVPLGFGIGMADFDADGDLDLAVANGHISVHVDLYEQPNQIFTNHLTELRREAHARGELLANGTPGWRPEAGLLRDVSAQAGEAVLRARVSRGLAIGDADGDGRLDLAINNVYESGELLFNTTLDGGGVVVLRLRGRSGNRNGVGARLVVVPCACAAGVDDCEHEVVDPADGAVGFPQHIDTKTTTSYLSQNTSDVHVGLGSASHAHVRVQWNERMNEEIGTVDRGELVLVFEGRGAVASRPLKTSSRGQ